MKICNKCAISKELSEFSKCKSIPGGHHRRCKSCDKIYNVLYREEKSRVDKKYRDKNKEKISLRNKKRRDENIEEHRKRERGSRDKRRDRERIRSKENYQKNKAKIGIRKNAYAKKNAAKYRGYCAKRNAAKLNATPKWLTKEHWRQIQAFYDEAHRLTMETGIPHEVDHIEPLQGKDVCGLHVPWNLRVIRMELNRQKGNSTNHSSSA
jgi:hypothetical protein